MKRKLSVIAGLASVALVITTPAFAAAVTTSANTTINATISPTISIASGTTVAIAITPTGAGAASSASDTVTVSTNNTLGYNLSLADSDTNTNLVNGANNIGAHAGTFGAPSTLANNSWGYRVDGAGTFGAGPSGAQTNATNLTGTWAGVPSSAAPQQLKTTATTATNDTTTVWYGVKSDTTKPSGVYSDQVTYTAVTN
jgi:hypothetical protein